MSGPPKTRYGIPIDDDGFVPEAELLKRFKRYYDAKQTEYDISRLSDPKKPRVVLAKRDYDYTSDTVIPLKCTPDQVMGWWNDPSSCDVQDIDTAGPPKVNVPSDMTPDQKRDQGRIKVVATPSEEKKLRRELVRTYEPEDLRKIAATRPTMAVRPTGAGYTGRYVPDREYIELDRQKGLDQGTVAHETAHLLRRRDKDRDDLITTSNAILSIEESCTVAEQMARSDEPDYTGYYLDVAVYDERRHRWRRPSVSEARRMAEEDHMLFTHGRGRGLKGEEALRSVEQNWGRSHIARLWTDRGLAVNVMADTYGNVERVSMAKPRTKRETEAGIAGASGGPATATARKGNLFRKRSRKPAQGADSS